MKARILALFLILALLISSLSGCLPNITPDPAETTAGDVTTDETTSAEPEGTTAEPEGTTTDNGSAEPEPEPEEKTALFSAETLANTKIVYPANSDDVFKVALRMLASNLATAFSAKKPQVVASGSSIGEDELLIFIGSFADQANAEAKKNLRPDDFVIYREGNRIYVCGGSDAGTERAIKYLNTHAKDLQIYSDKPNYFYGDYALQNPTVNGVSLFNYTIVLPRNPGVYEIYAADIFRNYVERLTGYTLTLSLDSQETQYEILIGNTSHTESGAEIKLGAQEYTLFADGDKIVCLGDSYFVAAGLAELISSLSGSETESVTLSSTPSARTFEYKEANNAILLIGDGMGFNSIAMAQSLGTVKDFYAYDMAVLGESKTNNVDGATTDSAAGGTALSTGFKTKNGYIGVDQNVKALLNLRELAYMMGAKTAVLTTDTITGATPAAFLAHQQSRNSTAEIQSEINALVSGKQIDFCEGSVGDALLAKTEEALFAIEDGESFFIMIEEAYIDKNSHSNKGAEMSAAAERFNKTIAYSMVFTVFNPDTVLIVTADHETGGIKNAGNSYYYTSTGHTSANVPIFACGKGTEKFNGVAVENVEIAKFIATVYGAKHFGR